MNEPFDSCFYKSLQVFLKQGIGLFEGRDSEF